ncbi:MAG: PQQ-binding-like beta-propeller repeat protein [Pirellulaceae bacterium]|nr:PQQ-binding-like beta-propeller repeat protein [Pirellulaceae bacterium]
MILSFRCGIAVAVLLSTMSAFADDWAQFLGPARNGISSEKGLIDQWPAGGLPEVWRKPAGVGMSGVVVVDGKAVTTFQRSGSQQVSAWDALTGKVIWKTKVAPSYRNAQGNGPRGTPAVADGRVFAFTGEGVLAAVELSSGRTLWTKNALRESGGREADFGMACSPVVVGELVVVTLGGPNACNCAFNVKTGELVWKSGDDPAGYSSPAVLKIDGKEQIVSFTGKAAIGMAPNDGAALWRYDFVTDFDCNIATPILCGKDRVFISAGENHGSSLLSIKADGGKYRVSEVWASHGPGSVLRSAWQTAILHQGHLYGFDNVGAAGPVMHLTCVDAETGERKWRQARFGKGNLIAADGKLFVTTMAGELVVIKQNPDKYDELGRMKNVLDMTRQAPALSDGRLYVRDDRDIVCLDARKAK